MLQIDNRGLLKKAVVVILTAVSCCAFGQTNKGVQFTEAQNWQQVLSIAKNQKKLIMVDAYTTWCLPCKAMDADTFPDSTLGKIVNENFIAVKIQMDSNLTDGPHTTRWREDAKKIALMSRIQAYPTILFFNAGGELLFKSVGFKDAVTLTKIASYLRSESEITNLKQQLHAYQNGQKDYTRLPELIAAIRDLMGDEKTALEMAKDYTKNYLNHLSDSAFGHPSNIHFINSNGGAMLLSLHDRMFSMCYDQPLYIDSILQKGSAEWYVKSVILKEKVLPIEIKSGGKGSPDWRTIYKSIRYYKKIDADRFMLEIKVAYYLKSKNWNQYSLLKSKQIKKYRDIVLEQNPFDDLNTWAWSLFLECKERKALKRALHWSELSIESAGDNSFPAYYDTRANILHKLGRTDEAIYYQKIAIEKNNKIAKQEGRNWFPEYALNLEKMLRGEPTWPCD